MAIDFLCLTDHASDLNRIQKLTGWHSTIIGDLYSDFLARRDDAEDISVLEYFAAIYGEAAYLAAASQGQTHDEAEDSREHTEDLILNPS